MAVRNPSMAVQLEDAGRRSGPMPSVECLDLCDPDTASGEIALSRRAAFKIAGTAEDGYDAFADIRLDVLGGDRRAVESGGKGYFHTCVSHRIMDIARKTSFRETSFESMLETARSRGDGDASRHEHLFGFTQQPDLVELEEADSRKASIRLVGRRIASFLENLNPLARAVMNAGLRDLIRKKVVKRESADDLEVVVSEIEEAWGVDLGCVTGTGELARVLGIKPNTVSLWLHRLWKRLLAQLKDERFSNGASGGVSYQPTA